MENWRDFAKLLLWDFFRKFIQQMNIFLVIIISQTYPLHHKQKITEIHGNNIKISIFLVDLRDFGSNILR